MDEAKYTVINMTKEDVPKVLDVRRETGFLAGKRSLYIWLEVDPEAIKIAVTDEGEVIGVCSAVIHQEDLAFFGFYCVRKKYRGIGIGLKLWYSCLDHIADRNACLYAPSEKTELYRNRGGFPIVESEWFTLFHRLKPTVNVHALSDSPPKGVNIEFFEESQLPLMYDYDRKLIGYDRLLAIELTCKQPETQTYVAIKNGKCAGFGIITMSCQEYSLLGPLYADNKNVGEVLLKKLILSVPRGKGLALMTVGDNNAANELIGKIGFRESLKKCHILYRKKPLDIDIDRKKVYAVFDCSFSTY